MEIIDQIRQVANIVDIASQYTTLIKHGQKYVGLCPFHSEKTPSFTVDNDKQLYHCFGCGAGGDIFTLVMEKENLGFPEALRYLAKKYNIRLPDKKKFSSQKLKLEEMLYKISENALAFFKKNLFNTKEGQKALGYLEKRKISEEIIQKLKIGYAMNSWDALLSHFQGNNISPGVLEKAGLVLRRQKKEGYYDRFRGRIIFPIFTETGKVVAFGGRTIIKAEPKYLNSPDTLIYTKGKLLYGINFCKESIREKGEVILVEGYTDFLSLYQAGITNCAASLGTSLTTHQVSIARNFAPRMIISYDGDDAGTKASVRGISLCFERGVQIKVLTLPDGMDPDSFIRKSGVDKFKSLVQNSTGGLKFLINTLIRKTNLEIPEEKAKVVNHVLTEIEKIANPFIRSEYLKKTSEHLSINEEDLRAMIRQKSKGEKPETKGYFLNAEKRLLQVLFENSSFTTPIFNDMNEQDFKGLKSEPIFHALSQSIRNGKSLNLNELMKKIDPSLRTLLSEILQETREKPNMEKVKDYIQALKKHAREKQSEEINAQISKLERSGEQEKSLSLLPKRQKITEELSQQND